MRKVVIFATGMIAGAVALPVTLVYVKPVRNKIAKVISKRIVDTLCNDQEARTDLIDLASEVTASVILLDEIKKAR